MKKGLKKCLSIVLTIAMLVSVMSVSFIANATEDTVTINGKTYAVGDTIEVKKEITINKWLLNGQVSIPYNSDVLKFVEEEPSKMFPVANGHSLEYFDTGSKINFNFTDVTNGIDFTQGGILYDLTFEVIAGSAEEVTIDDDLQVISTFRFAGDPQSEENQGKPVVYPFDSALENGTIPADKGTEGEIDIKGPEAETLTINGYEATVGETVYISKKIQVNNNWLMNGQISVKYDPEYLRFAPVEDEKMFPNVSLNLMYNDVKKDGVSVGEIRITFTNPIVGYDFTTEKVLYDLPFTVIKGSDTAKNVTDEIEDMRSFNFAGNPADETNPNYTMVNIVDKSTGEIDAAKGTTDAEPVVADTPAVTDKIIVNDIEVVAGDEINHYLNTKDDNWFVNGQYEITFNNTVLDLVVNADSITYPVITAAGVSVFDNVVDNGDGTSTIYFNFSTLQGVSFEELGKVFDFYFTVKEDAAPGNYTVDTKIVETYVFSTPGQPDGSSYDMTNVYNEETGKLDVQESNLVTKIKDIDTSALKALIEEAKALTAKEGYTAESVQALTAAIAHAKTVAEAPESVQAVADEITALQAAIDGLVVDTAALTARIAEAKVLAEKEGYTAESIAALNAAIAAAEAVVKNPTVENVKAQLEALKAAMDAVKPDTTALKAAIAAAKEKLADDKYSPTSKAALQAAVDAGKELLAKVETESVAYEAVVAATGAINTAIGNLVEGVLLGDANDDDKVNIDDATYIQNFLVKLEDVINELAADVNKDGKLTVMDTTMIQVRLATGTEDEYVFSDEI